MNKDNEQILVVPSEVIFAKGKWQGLKTDNLDYYLDLIKNNCQFKRRGDMENNPGFQQIIPYILFNFENKYFLYKYLPAAGEQRLIDTYQLGIGGHLNELNIEQGMMREWQEEINFSGKILEKKLIGIINDDSRPVEQVHLGLVYEFTGDSPDISVKETNKMQGELVDSKKIGNYIKGNDGVWVKIVFENYLKPKIKKIIGVAGEIGAGKDTICQYLKENYPNVFVMRFSDGLTEALKVFFDDIKREDQQWLSSVLRERFGGDILTKALIKKVNSTKDGIAILNGVRRSADFEVLKSMGGRLVYITAETKTRWERVVQRKEKADDDVSFEKFLELCGAEAEQQISIVGREADFKIENNGTKEELYLQIKKIL